MLSSQNSDFRKALEKELKQYHSEYPIELGFRDRMLDLLDYDNCFERSLLHAHFTASAWLVNESLDKALFTHHAKLNKWLQLGGHSDGNENLREVALNESYEESGLREISFLSRRIFDLDIHTIPARKEVPEHEHFDVRFILQASEQDILVISEESHDIAWISFDNIVRKTQENESIKRMMNKTIQIRL